MKLDNGTGIKGRNSPSLQKEKPSYKVEEMSMASNFISLTLEAEGYYNKAFQIMEESDLWPEIVHHPS